MNLVSLISLPKQMEFLKKSFPSLLDTTDFTEGLVKQGKQEMSKMLQLTQPLMCNASCNKSN